jgi:hypothetical protein
LERLVVAVAVVTVELLGQVFLQQVEQQALVLGRVVTVVLAVVRVIMAAPAVREHQFIQVAVGVVLVTVQVYALGVMVVCTGLVVVAVRHRLRQLGALAL